MFAINYIISYILLITKKKMARYCGIWLYGMSVDEFEFPKYELNLLLARILHANHISIKLLLQNI